MDEAKYAKFQMLVAKLQAIREKYGEDAFNAAARDAAKQFTAEGGEAAEFAKEAFKDVPGAFEGPSEPEPEQGSSNPLIEMIRQQMPGIKTQAQFDAFMSGFDGLRIAMNGVFLGNDKEVADGRAMIERAFEVAMRVTTVVDKLRDVPEAATSEEAEQFKQAPREFIEEGVCRDLLGELEVISKRDVLSTWYTASRKRIELVKTPKLRNELFDAIRAKRKELEGE
jgi:hypothetical protein